jgi:hypothetical protein
MGLTEDLHNLVDNPPPPSFELDDLMQRRRARRAPSRALLGIAGFAAVAMILVGGYLLKPDSHPARHTPFGAGSTTPSATPTATPSATPTATTPDYSAIAARLSATLAKLPKALHVPTDGSAKFHWQPMTGAIPPVQYFVSWKYKGVTYGISIFDGGEQPNPAENGCKPPYAGEMDCRRTIDKSGITYHLNNAIDKLDPVRHTQASLLEVVYYATDETQIQVTENATNHYVLPLTNTTIMAAAAHNPGLSLNP